MLASPMTFARRPLGALSRIVPGRRRHKREKLAAQLTWLANRSDLAAVGRRHDRITPTNGDATCS